MSTRLKPYATYRDTGAEWLGKVPSHWSVLPHRAVFREIIDKGHPGEEMLSVTIERGVLKQADLLRNTSKKDSSNEDKSSYKLVHAGDIAYNKMRAWQGALGVSPFQGIVSPAYIIVRPRQAQNTNYYHHLMRTPAFTTEAERWSYGITSDQWSLRSEDFKCIQTVVPPQDEQAQIVRFIRHLDQRVNRLIKTKRRLIELLNEQKQAIIHRAVTRGLDPTVPLKPSGIEWLGDIPQHWQTIAIKRLLKRMDYGTSESSTDEGAIRVLTMGHIRDGEVNVPASGGLDVVPDILLLEQNDLLFNRTNSPDLVGKVGIFRGTADDRVSFASYLVRLRVLDQHSPFWLNYLLGSREFWGFARSQALVSLHQANLNSTRYGQILVPVPPTTEQLEIAEHLREALAIFELALAKARSEIDFIREYRTRLVADVVTGQLDVRYLDLPEVEESLIEPILDTDDEGLEFEEGELVTV